MDIHTIVPNTGYLIFQAIILIKNNNTIDDLLDIRSVFLSYQ